MADQLPIDESVKVPPAVAAAAAAAEELHKQAYADPAPSGDDPAAPVAAEPEAAPAEEPAPAPEPAKEAPAPEPNWEHRYKSMEGRVRQLTEINHTLSTNLQQLSNVVNDKTRQLPPAKPLITDDERRTYGDDLLSVVERKAIEAVSPHLQQLQNENRQLRERLARDETRSIYDTLSAELPDWRDLNVSPEFLQWLSLPDLYSGQLRSGLLRAAFDAGDAPRVLAFFRGFLAEHPEYAGAQSPAPPAAASAPRQAAMQLRDLAAPGKARPTPGSTPRSAEPVVITNKDIDRFYENVRKGVYRGREDKKDAEEAIIMAAIREGRVRRVK